MKVSLLSYSKPNLQLAYTKSDAECLLAGSHFIDNLFEYAGRLCYHSVGKMYHSKSFLKARLDEGHEDIIEHATATLYVENCPGLWRLLLLNRYLNLSEVGNRGWVASANLRVWLGLIRFARQQINQYFSDFKEIDPIYQLLNQDILRIMRSIAPTTFAEFGNDVKIVLPDTPCVNVQLLDDSVTLLGANISPLNSNLHSSATFLIEHIDRAESMQILRHRLGSYSQVSQRYTDLNKADWSMIMPDEFAHNQQMMNITNAHWEITKDSYLALRELGAKKEDARCLLPNMCETRFVVTMPIYGWQHFLGLRLDKAAQAPVRKTALAIQKALQDLAPTTQF
jgi:flavin-dependent thymidylate synthase